MSHRWTHFPQNKPQTTNHQKGSKAEVSTRNLNKTGKREEILKVSHVHDDARQVFSLSLLFALPFPASHSTVIRLAVGKDGPASVCYGYGTSSLRRRRREMNGLSSYPSLFFYHLGCNNTSVISLDLIRRICERCIKKNKKRQQSERVGAAEENRRRGNRGELV